MRSAAAHTSPALCGGIDVAMPTAMPAAPLASRFGNAARQHDRFLLLAVIGGAEIDRVVVDAGEQRARHLGQPRLGVAHGRGVIAVDVAEIALALDQRIARGEILRQPHQRVVHRDVAMRVEFADHVADHARAFLEAGGGIEAQLLHRVDQPPMHRLQPVAHVRQRARHDGGERIGEIALGERIGERRVLDLAGQIVRHPGLRDCREVTVHVVARDVVAAAGNGRCWWPNASRARKCPVRRSPSRHSAASPGRSGRRKRRQPQQPRLPVPRPPPRRPRARSAARPRRARRVAGDARRRRRRDRSRDRRAAPPPTGSARPAPPTGRRVARSGAAAR